MKNKPLSPELDTIELHDDAWERTEQLIKATVARKPVPQDSEAKPKRAERGN